MWSTHKTSQLNEVCQEDPDTLPLSSSPSPGQSESWHGQWAGGLPQPVALRHGLLYMGKVGDLSGHYLFQSQHLQKRFESEF